MPHPGIGFLHFKATEYIEIKSFKEVIIPFIK